MSDQMVPLKLGIDSKSKPMRVAFLLALIVLVVSITGPVHMACHGGDAEDPCSACHQASTEFDHELGLLVDVGSAQSCEEAFLFERIVAPCLGQIAPRAPPLG